MKKPPFKIGDRFTPKLNGIFQVVGQDKEIVLLFNQVIEITCEEEVEMMNTWQVYFLGSIIPMYKLYRYQYNKYDKDNVQAKPKPEVMTNTERYEGTRPWTVIGKCDVGKKI